MNEERGREEMNETEMMMMAMSGSTTAHDSVLLNAQRSMG